jgi:purine-cytosine permease-like protein
MKRLLNGLTIFVIVAVVTVIFGLQVVQALREWAAPAPLPYGLSLIYFVRASSIASSIVIPRPSS